MDRRTFIAMVGGAGIGGLLSKFSFGSGIGRALNFGYIPNPTAVREFIDSTARPYFSDWSRSIRGDGQNKQIHLLKAYEKVTAKPFEPHLQSIGSCVGEGHTLGAEVLSTVQIVSGKNEQWKGKFSVEVQYAGSRTAPECGNGSIRRGDGSNGVWAATFQQKYGMVLRGKYGDIDISDRRDDLSRSWGRSGVGVPKELIAVSREHPVKTVALITSFDQFADAIANGYPVAICSGQGFTNKADRDGFLRPSGSWSHCMLGCGIDTKSRRRGGFIMNSWGPDWCSGIDRHICGMYPGGFWADAEVIDHMLGAGDSWALSDFKGFPRRRLDYILV